MSNTKQRFSKCVPQETWKAFMYVTPWSKWHYAAEKMAVTNSFWNFGTIWYRIASINDQADIFRLTCPKKHHRFGHMWLCDHSWHDGADNWTVANTCLEALKQLCVRLEINNSQQWPEFLWPGTIKDLYECDSDSSKHHATDQWIATNTVLKQAGHIWSNADSNCSTSYVHETLKACRSL